MLLTARIDDEVRAYLAAALLRKLTEQTETRRARLLDTVRQSRIDQASEVVDEVIEGIRGMFALVREAGGKVLGVLIIAGASSHIAAKRDLLWDVLRSTVEQVDRDLGYGAR